MWCVMRTQGSFAPPGFPSRGVWSVLIRLMPSDVAGLRAVHFGGCFFTLGVVVKGVEARRLSAFLFVERVGIQWPLDL